MGNEKQQKKPPLWERVVAVFGLLMLAALLGYLGYRIATGNGHSPAVVVTARAIERNVSGYVVRIQARNHGDQTAAGVKVTGRLQRKGVVLEKSEATFAYIPSHSIRRGGLFFTRDPRKYELVLEPSGYVQP